MFRSCRGEWKGINVLDLMTSREHSIHPTGILTPQHLRIHRISNPFFDHLHSVFLCTQERNMHHQVDNIPMQHLQVTLIPNDHVLTASDDLFGASVFKFQGKFAETSIFEVLGSCRIDPYRNFLCSSYPDPFRPKSSFFQPFC